MKVLFVCSSNVCRSPYCEYVFRRMVENNEVLKNKVTTCSSAVFNPMKEIDPKTRQTLIEREGFEPSYVDSHKPGFLWWERQKYDEADIIIGMTKSHKILLPRKYRKKFITLSEAAIGRYERIPDPWLEKDMNKYFEAMDRLKDYLQIYVEKLQREFLDK